MVVLILANTTHSTPHMQLDTELHNLLSAMASASPGSDSRDKMASAALLCRKIAILHPALMLRQLPMMGWLLRGRAHLTIVEFRNQNHKKVFVNIFSILEQLQPLIFKNSQVSFSAHPLYNLGPKSVGYTCKLVQGFISGQNCPFSKISVVLSITGLFSEVSL